jgi:phosphate uptake regulator
LDLLIPNVSRLIELVCLEELRKVQRTATGTFFVCLPRRWADQNGLKKGVLVGLNQTTDGKLVIDPKRDSESSPRVVVLKAGQFLGREIVSSYLLGFDVIQIDADERIDLDLRKVVKATVSSLIGLEIIEENYAQIVLQCLLEPSGFPPEKILRRNYAIVAGMNRDAVNSFAEGDLQLAKSVIARDDESNRLYFLLVRILRTIIQTSNLIEKPKITAIDCLDYRLAASLVEAIGDSSVNVATKTLELKGLRLSEKLRRALVNSQLTCYDAHEQALKAFINKDSALAQNIRNLNEKIQASLLEIQAIAKDEPLEVMPHILAVVSNLTQIYEYTVDLADLVV